MTKKTKSITIDGVEYVPKSDSSPAKDFKGMKYCIVRSYDAGVFAAYVEKDWVEDGVYLALLQKSRRLWYWDGAASLSQLAMEGVKKPENCKFPCEVNDHKVARVCEIIPCTKEAQESINKVPIWEK